MFYPQFILISILLLGVIFFNYDSISRLFLIFFFLLEFLFLTFSKKIRSDVSKSLRISGIDLVGLGIISNDEDVNILNDWLIHNKKHGFYYKNLELDNKYSL